MQVQQSLFTKAVIEWSTEIRRLKFYSKRNVWLNVYEAMGGRGVTVTAQQKCSWVKSVPVPLHPPQRPNGVDHCGRKVHGVGLRPYSCRDCRFDSRRRDVCLSVCCECRLLTGKGLRDGPIPRPKERERERECVCVCVIVCDTAQ
jgi:hypothetical protein